MSNAFQFLKIQSSGTKTVFFRNQKFLSDLKPPFVFSGIYNRCKYTDIFFEPEILNMFGLDSNGRYGIFRPQKIIS